MIINKLINKLKYLHQQRNKKRFDKNLIKIRNNINKYILNNSIKSNKKILFILNFSIFKPNKVHDFLLSQSLILRGAKIIPVVCGGMQEGQCASFGGVWGNYYSNKIKSGQCIKEDNCKKCIAADFDLWKKWAGIEPIFLSKWLNYKDKLVFREIANNYSIEDYVNWEYDGISIGKSIIKTIRNNELLIDLGLVSKREQLLRNYLLNSIFLIEGLKKILIDVKPNFIVTNNTFYQPWYYLEILAKRNDIPIYLSGPGGRKNTWCYATNQRAVPADKNANLIWNFWKNKKLSKNENELISNYISDFSSGRSLIVNTVSVSSKGKALNKEVFRFITGNKKVFLLIPNIAWDAAVLDVDYIFSDMFSWIVDVVKFFIKHKDFKLIIKPHPAEINKTFPESREKVKDVISNVFGKLPNNIFLLEPSANVSVSDLFNQIDVGLVYSSTVGLEMAVHGIPVITAGKGPYWGKGFTYDANSKEEYFEFLKTMFKGEISSEQKDIFKDLAKKFFYVYHYILYTHTGVFEWDIKENINMNFSYKELLPGNNVTWDYICDSIIRGEDVINEKRFPPVVVNGKVITKSPQVN